MSSIILEVPKMNWNDCYNSFAMAIYGAVRYTEKIYSLEEILFYTGQGFKINTNNKVAPMDVLGDGSLLQPALSNIGFDSAFLAANVCGYDWSENAPSQGIDMIRESINRGMPAISWNLDNAEFGLVYGYDDQRQVLSVHDINARNGGELSYEIFGRHDVNGQPFDPLLFVFTLKDRGETPLLHATRYTPEQDLSYRTALEKALDLIVTHMGGSEPAVGSMKNGIAAIEAWQDAVESGNAHPFFTTYNILWITSARQYIVNFFVRSSITHCMSIQDIILQRLMMEASQIFLEGFYIWVTLRQLFPFPNGADPKQADIKEETQRLLSAARKAELSGLELLMRMQQHLQKARKESE